MHEPREDSAPHKGRERRVAFFPRRLREVPPEDLLVGEGKDRRQGEPGRRRGDKRSTA